MTMVFFSIEEQTSEQIETMEDFISDTGRNLAPIGALIFNANLFSYSVAYIIYF